MNFSIVIFVIIALILVIKIKPMSKKHQVNKDIYFVTGIQNRTNSESVGRSRCWGYFFNLEEAKKDVTNNYTDMAENNYYNFIVIEKIPSGILPCITGIEIIQWYMYNPKIDKYEDCETPEWSKNIVQWAL
jgi:hypothetical protein